MHGELLGSVVLQSNDGDSWYYEVVFDGPFFHLMARLQGNWSACYEMKMLNLTGLVFDESPGRLLRDAWDERTPDDLQDLFSEDFPVVLTRAQRVRANFSYFENRVYTEVEVGEHGMYIRATPKHHEEPFTFHLSWSLVPELSPLEKMLFHLGELNV